MWRIGVDLGGTKIEAILLSADGEIHERVRVPAPRGTYEGTLGAIVSLVSTLAGKHSIQGNYTLGMGIPGSLSPKTGLVRNANSTWLIGEDLRGDLERRLNVRPAIGNDANCFALSEATDGAGAGFNTVFGIILGTGVGGGLTVGGRVLAGRNHIAGEWGHNPLPWRGEMEPEAAECYCGKRGCIETYLCGPALERQYTQRAGQTIPAKLIGERAEAGEPDAEALMELYTDRLARALATVINIFDPDVIVLGGGVSNIPAVLSRTHAKLPSWVFTDHFDGELRRNRWGDSSGVRGAAWLPLLQG
jgi:fructokinase